MTIAECVARLLVSGDRFETEDGWHLHEIAVELEADVQTDRCLMRYVFKDGSAIVASDYHWDLEGTKPWSFAGEEALREE